jgi:hypothetical protein
MTSAVTAFRYLGFMEGHICQQHWGVRCFECYRSERERQRARAHSTNQPSMLRLPFDARPPLSDREIAHRRRMLAHLAVRRTSGNSRARSSIRS